MGRIPDSVVDEIRERVDIVDLISRYIALKPAGRNHKGLCPFHSEKTPSFNVSRDRQIFHCFGCGVGGNVFSFLIRHDNLTFPEAVRMLARECGVEIAEEEADERDRIARLAKANELAQRLYQSALASPEGAAARAYLAERGLDAASIERFGVGFAPDRWDAVARALAAGDLSPELGERAGLLAVRASGGYYDRLRARVTFPIHDVHGRVLGFGGRATKTGQEPKYLNTPETALFRKREALYGLPLALEASRREDRLVVVEGYFDLVALHRAGIESVVATCGTALTPEHGKALRRRVREVVLLFDGDAAGERAVAAALEVLLPHGLRVRAARLPSGDDPDTYLGREGAEALRALVARAPAALEGMIARAVAPGISTPWEKADAVAQVAPLLALVQDPVERGELVRRLALAVDVDVRHVEIAVRSAARGGSSDALPAPTASPRRDEPGDRGARTVAALLLGRPELAGRVSEAELSAAIPEGAWQELALALHRSAAAGEEALASGLADRLAGEARDLLFALAIAEEPELEAKDAERALEETLARLGRRRLAREAKALTQRLRLSPTMDADLLAAKQRQLEQKKVALGFRPGTATGR
ncbi:MAG TPA: DNA primase [Deltaproteobacteria bacterium]|nr:DNA primase [Deltaproteobacteria bacterium]